MTDQSNDYLSNINGNQQQLPNATTTLVLGILSIVVCFICGIIALVISNKDVALMWGEEADGSVRVRLNYYVKAKKLIRVHRGLYAKDKNYRKACIKNTMKSLKKRKISFA